VCLIPGILAVPSRGGAAQELYRVVSDRRFTPVAHNPIQKASAAGARMLRIRHTLSVCGKVQA